MEKEKTDEVEVAAQENEKGKKIEKTAQGYIIDFFYLGNVF